MTPAFLPAAAVPRGSAHIARPALCRRTVRRAAGRAVVRMGPGEDAGAPDAPSDAALGSEAAGSVGAVETAGAGSEEGAKGDVRQMLGIRGASDETVPKWRLQLQLMKPVTWVPLVWGVMCGAAASGGFHWDVGEDIAKALVCMVLAGPFLTGYTQVINDWYDREIDAINEPYRPIPSGLISEADVRAQVAVLLLAGFGTSVGLDLWAGHEWFVNTALTAFGVFVAYIYSAPPLKLKQNGWAGSYALGASYISLPWWAGQALFGTLDWKTMVLTLFYSLAGLGIAIINDFKSVEGDRATGMQSLPVMFGIDAAKWICVGTIDVFQLLVAAILWSVGEHGYAAAIAALVAPQAFLQQKYFLKDPVKYDVKYQASAQPFLVIGILVAGLAVGHHGPL